MASKLKIQATAARRYEYKIRSIPKPEVNTNMTMSMIDINHNKDCIRCIISSIN